jgi:ATP-dependent Clp protease adaptor protein ClpS
VCGDSQSRLLAPLHVTPRHNGGVPDVVETPLGVQHAEPEQSLLDDRPWIVLVWNDPINLMSYVTLVFQKLFGYSVEKATRLMLDVHEKGRAVVSQGTREKAEIDVYRLHEHGLWATMQKDDSGQL